MAFYQLTSTPEIDFALEYGANLRVSAIYCNNRSTFDVFGSATLSSGQTFERTFPPGETRTSIPGTAVKMVTEINPDDGSSVTYPQGLQSYSFSIKYT